MKTVPLFPKLTKKTGKFNIDQRLGQYSLGSYMYKNILVAAHQCPIFIAALQRAGLDPKKLLTGLHKARGTFITMMVKLGVDINAIASVTVE